MTYYLVAVAALMLGAIAPSFAAGDSAWRGVRAVPIFAVYPLFVVMLLTHGIKAAALTWIALAIFALSLELIADAWSAPGDRQSFLRAAGIAALVWPLSVTASLDYLLVRLGLASPRAEIRLPEPPRGDALFALPDDDLLVSAHQLLLGAAQLTKEESTVVVAETFNREVHGGGFYQWFVNTSFSVPDTIQSLAEVGAIGAAALLRRAAEAAPSSWTAARSIADGIRGLEQNTPRMRAFDDEFFSLEREEDLTARIATFIRRNRSRFPSLEIVTSEP